MRTTVTLDDDLALRLEQLRAESGQSFKEVINEVIRIGLERRGLIVTRQGEARRPLKTLDLGGPALVDLTNAWEAIAIAEGEDHR